MKVTLWIFAGVAAGYLAGRWVKHWYQQRQSWKAFRGM